MPAQACLLNTWWWCSLGGCGSFRTWDISNKVSWLGSQPAGLQLHPTASKYLWVLVRKRSSSHLHHNYELHCIFPTMVVSTSVKSNPPSRCFLSCLCSHSNEKNNPYTWCRNPSILEFYLVLILIQRILNIEKSRYKLKTGQMKSQMLSDQLP